MKLSDIKAKILIIDDDTDIRKAIRLTLESETEVDYTFEEASNVSSGLKILEAAKPDVVILDIHMPGEDGFAFLNKINRARSLPKTKVMVLTADNSMKNLWKAEQKNISPYNFLGKPFVNEELRAVVLSMALA